MLEKEAVVSLGIGQAERRDEGKSRREGDDRSEAAARSEGLSKRGQGTELEIGVGSVDGS